MRPAWNSRYSYKESNKVSYEGRFSPVYPSFKGKLLPSASSECCWALSAFYPRYIPERSIAVPSMTSAFTRELERLVVAQVSATLSFLFTTRLKDSNSHTSLAGLHKFRDGRVRSSRCFSWIAFAARRYYPSLRQHVSSKVHTLLNVLLSIFNGFSNNLVSCHTRTWMSRCDHALQFTTGSRANSLASPQTRAGAYYFEHTRRHFCPRRRRPLCRAGSAQRRSLWSPICPRVASKASVAPVAKG